MIATSQQITDSRRRHVFLAHDQADQAVARTIGDALRADGMRVSPTGLAGEQFNFRHAAHVRMTARAAQTTRAGPRARLCHLISTPW